MWNKISKISLGYKPEDLIKDNQNKTRLDSIQELGFDLVREGYRDDDLLKIPDFLRNQENLKAESSLIGQGPLIVSRAECSEKAWALLKLRADEITKLRAELVQVHKQLCKHNGHLPITDHEGNTYCELCQEKI